MCVIICTHCCAPAEHAACTRQRRTSLYTQIRVCRVHRVCVCMCVCVRASRCKFACTSIEIKTRTRARPRTRIDLNSLLRRNETQAHICALGCVISGRQMHLHVPHQQRPGLVSCLLTVAMALLLFKLNPPMHIDWQSNSFDNLKR